MPDRPAAAGAAARWLRRVVIAWFLAQSVLVPFRIDWKLSLLHPHLELMILSMAAAAWLITRRRGAWPLAVITNALLGLLVAVASGFVLAGQRPPLGYVSLNSLRETPALICSAGFVAGSLAIHLLLLVLRAKDIFGTPGARPPARRWPRPDAATVCAFAAGIATWMLWPPPSAAEIHTIEQQMREGIRDRAAEKGVRLTGISAVMRPDLQTASIRVEGIAGSGRNTFLYQNVRAHYDAGTGHWVISDIVPLGAMQIAAPLRNHILRANFSVLAAALAGAAAFLLFRPRTARTQAAPAALNAPLPLAVTLVLTMTTLGFWTMFFLMFTPVVIRSRSNPTLLDRLFTEFPVPVILFASAMVGAIVYLFRRSGHEIWRIPVAVLLCLGLGAGVIAPFAGPRLSPVATTEEPLHEPSEAEREGSETANRSASLDPRLQEADILPETRRASRQASWFGTSGSPAPRETDNSARNVPGKGELARLTVSVQKSAKTTTAPPAPPSYEPATDRVVLKKSPPAGSVFLGALVDLDTGEVITPPPEILNLLQAPEAFLRETGEGKTVHAWMRANGVDLYVGSSPDGSLAALQIDGLGHDLAERTPGADSQTFDRFSAEELTQRWEEAKQQPAETANPRLSHRHTPQAYSLFQTREGSVGLMEVNPAENGGVQIRYKVLSGHSTRWADVATVKGPEWTFESLDQMFAGGPPKIELTPKRYRAPGSTEETPGTLVSVWLPQPQPSEEKGPPHWQVTARGRDDVVFTARAEAPATGDASFEAFLEYPLQDVEALGLQYRAVAGPDLKLDEKIAPPEIPR